MKTQIQIKRNLYVVMITFFALLTTSCVVPKAGGGAVKNGTFTLNITSKVGPYFPEGTSDQKNIILYDGDQVLVKIKNVFNRDTPYPYLYTRVEVSAKNKNNQPITIEQIPGNLNVYPQGIVFNENNNWVNSTNNTIFYNKFGAFYEGLTNYDGYLVFRKKEAGSNEYVYFWLHFKYLPASNSSDITSTIKTGKYQVGSITTGI